jgi:hypothetical protein
MLRPFIFLSLLLSAGLDAQPLDVRAPIVGFLHHTESGAIRPLLGVPGSAVLGPAVLRGVTSASIAPDGRWALIKTDGGARLISLAPSESSAENIIEAADRVVWTRSGSFAVLYSSSTRQLQRVRLSRTQAFPDSPVSVSWGEVTSLAIDAAGRQIAVGVAELGLYLLRVGEAAPTLLPAIGRPGALAFDEDGRLYAVDGASQRILRFDAAGGAVEFASLTEPGEPATDPVGLALSKGGRYLLLADRATRAVRMYETGSGNLASTISLDFAPSRMEPLSSAPSFLLNEPGPKEWLLILNAADFPSVSFVPRDREEAQ